MSDAPPQKDAPHKPAPGERYGFLLYVGVLIGGLGAAALYFLSKSGKEVDDITRYSALGAVVAGVMFCYLSSLPKVEAISWLKSGGTALLVAFVFRWAVGEPYRIPSSSMEPTLNGDERAFRGDRVWVNKWWYGWKWPFTNTRIFNWHDPERWDIVVFNSVEKDAKHPVLVKRVVGLPGERINIHDGTIFVNGKPLTLKPGMPPVEYTNDSYQMKYGVRTEDEFAVVPPGHYLVCGDNSANSRDGRFFGWLPNENIVGRVACIWWPLGNRRDFTGFTGTLWWRGVVGLLGLWVVIRMFIGRSYAAYNREGGVDHYWVSFIAYGLHIPFLGHYAHTWRRPQRGELVLYSITGDGIPEGATVAARVAALPGEQIVFKDGIFSVNGAPLPAGAWPSARAYAANSGEAAALAPRSNSLTLGPEEFYLLCDDPKDSEPYDSRVLGPAPMRVIVGRMTHRWWPRKRATRM